ncbi:MAG: class I SAM-dependent methyltransferase [Planctomycetes bacterium]|nr:class I SAM-dependent methyltransferase [Planctomycetota bacterium]
MKTDAPTVDDVRRFWEANPLFRGETQHEIGSREYFEEHRQVVIGDCFAGTLDERIFAVPTSARVLDLGCGPGFWLAEFGARGFADLHAADLTDRALRLAEQRCRVFGVSCTFQQQNAECLDFPDGMFDHVNCQGVIHHTPDTAASVGEIARVLRDDGTACLSVYYRNFVLRQWWWLRHPARWISYCGATLRGRGRETIFATAELDDLVRLYDGADNPIGKAYTDADFLALLAPHFAVEETFLHFFPKRSLPLPIPQSLHRWLDRNLGFMIYARVRKLRTSATVKLAA